MKRQNLRSAMSFEALMDQTQVAIRIVCFYHGIKHLGLITGDQNQNLLFGEYSKRILLCAVKKHA